MPDEREFGILQERVRALTDRIDSLEPKIDSLLAYIERQKGGWAVMIVVGSVAAAIGAAMSKIATWVLR